MSNILTFFFFFTCILTQALCDILYNRLRNTLTYLLTYLLTGEFAVNYHTDGNGQILGN